MASFKGVNFGDKGENATAFPMFATTAQSSILRPPSGSRIIIQSSGQKEQRLSLPIQCNQSQLTALTGAVDSTGQLSWSGGNRSAYLESISDPKRIGTGDLFQATLNFVGL